MRPVALSLCLCLWGSGVAQVELPEFPEVPAPELPVDVPLPEISDPGEMLPDLPDDFDLGEMPVPAIIPEILGPEGEAIVEEFERCKAESEDIDLCFETLEARYQELLGDLPFPPEPEVPEEERSGAYVDFMEFTDPTEWAVRLPSVHLGVTEEFEECSPDIVDCDVDFTLSTIFLPKELAEEAQEAIDEAWEKFVDAVIDDLDDAINKDPPCFINGYAPTCLGIVLGVESIPLPDFACAYQRILAELPTSIAEHNPVYWQEVAVALATHLPNSIPWGGTKLPFSVSVSPIVDAPQLTQYFSSDEVDDPRLYLYYAQAIQALGYPNMPAPLLPGDKREGVGGVYDIEKSKTEWAPATPYEYQEFGFASFYELWPEVTWTQFFDTAFLYVKPGIQLYCWAIPLVLKVPLVKVPTPAFAPALKGLSGYASVAESGYLGRVEMEDRPLIRPRY